MFKRLAKATIISAALVLSPGKGWSCPITNAMIGSAVSKTKMRVTHVAYEAVYECYQVQSISGRQIHSFRVPEHGALTLPFENQYEQLSSVAGIDCQTPNKTTFYKGVMEDGQEVILWVFIGGGSPGTSAGSEAYHSYLDYRKKWKSDQFASFEWLPPAYQWEVEVGGIIVDLEYLAYLAGADLNSGPLGGGKIIVLECEEGDNGETKE